MKKQVIEKTGHPINQTALDQPAIICQPETFACLGKKMLLCILLGGLIFSSLPIWACSVPVFRYALECLSADSYRVTVFYRASLSHEEQALVNSPQKYSSGSDFHSNLVVDTVDLAAPVDKAAQELWETQFTVELPWMVVQFPRVLLTEETIWSGRFSATIVNAFLDSPVRREIARRILEGESAVWVLLEN